MQQVRQSMNLLTTDYQIGHTSYEEGEHFLVFKRVGGGEGGGGTVPSAPLFRGPWLCLYCFYKIIRYYTLDNWDVHQTFI